MEVPMKSMHLSLLPLTFLLVTGVGISSRQAQATPILATTTLVLLEEPDITKLGFSTENLKMMEKMLPDMKKRDLTLTKAARETVEKDVVLLTFTHKDMSEIVVRMDEKKREFTVQALYDIDLPLEQAKKLEDSLLEDDDFGDYEDLLFDFVPHPKDKDRTLLTLSDRDTFLFSSLVSLSADNIHSAVVELKKRAKQTPTDPLGQDLTASKLVYSDIGKFYKLIFDIKDTSRKQIIYVRKENQVYNSIETREIFSLCYDEKDPPSAGLLQSIFQKRYNIGGLTLEAPSDSQKNWRIRFRIDVLANLNPAALRNRIELVQSTADALEKEINPGKEDKL
jgi:hypothetical protein